MSLFHSATNAMFSTSWKICTGYTNWNAHVPILGVFQLLKNPSVVELSLTVTVSSFDVTSVTQTVLKTILRFAGAQRTTLSSFSSKSSIVLPLSWSSRRRSKHLDVADCGWTVSEIVPLPVLFLWDSVCFEFPSAAFWFCWLDGGALFFDFLIEDLSSVGTAEAFFFGGSKTLALVLGGRPFRLTIFSAAVFGVDSFSLVDKTLTGFLPCFGELICPIFGETEPSSSSLSLELDSWKIKQTLTAVMPISNVS